MAKFYQRYLPPTASGTVQYGYRGANLTVNGQFYTQSSLLEQVGNYQTTCACTDYGTCIAPIAVACVFEPSYYANSFDLSGSRFSGEYDAGQFQSWNTFVDPNGFTTFKNAGANSATIFTVQTSSAVSCLQGCVLTNFSSTGTYCCAYPSLCFNTSCFNSIYTTPFNNYLIVEDPAQVYTCFVPYTNMIQQATMCNTNYSSQWASICNGGPAFEPTYGDTTSSFNAVGGNNTCSVPQCGSPTPCYCWSNQCNSVYGYQGTTATMSDSQFWGTFNTSTIAQGITFNACNCYGNCSGFCYPTFGATINGAYPTYGKVGGTVEAGVRAMVVQKSPYLFYMLHNANNGGIQGVDTSTSSLNRLSLRSYNQTTTATTVLINYKKGLPGLMIPSQADSETSSLYRFYMLNFLGADPYGFTPTASLMSLTQVTLNLGTGAVTSNTNYTLTMTTSQQAQIYADQGVNGTFQSKYNNAQFRRQTVNRIWYSIDTNSVKRVHMGVYNTNGSGLVTAPNGFQNSSLQGAMFQIYSWSVTDAGASSTASYLGSVNLATYAPRYFCPLDANWNTIYAGVSFGNDITLSLNATTGLYQYATTMNYIASRLFQDYQGRWAAQVIDTSIAPTNGASSNYIDFLSNNVGNTVVISANTTTFIYTGTTITGNILVNVYNYLGNRTSSTVALNIIGATSTPGMQFSGAVYNTSVTCSTSTDTSVAIQIVSAASSKVIGTVTQN